MEQGILVRGPRTDTTPRAASAVENDARDGGSRGPQGAGNGSCLGSERAAAQGRLETLIASSGGGRTGTNRPFQPARMQG